MIPLRHILLRTHKYKVYDKQQLRNKITIGLLTMATMTVLEISIILSSAKIDRFAEHVNNKSRILDENKQIMTL